LLRQLHGLIKWESEMLAFANIVQVGWYNNTCIARKLLIMDWDVGSWVNSSCRNGHWRGLCDSGSIVLTSSTKVGVTVEIEGAGSIVLGQHCIYHNTLQGERS
jgi:hypothetical protein